MEGWKVSRLWQSRFVISESEVYYEGEFENGYMHGKGFMFSGGKLIGRGTCFFYTGDYKNNQHHGKGKMLLSDGSMYCGDFADGKMHGFGRYTFDDGCFYEGEFSRDCFHGKGYISYLPLPENDFLLRYEGLFQNDEKHGSGIAVFKDGHTEQWQFEQGERIK